MITQQSVQEIVSRYNDSAPLPDASTIPAPWYVDDRIAELEAKTVFGKTWQMVGRVEQVEKPGQFVTANVAGEPILVVRGSDGVLRGFFNVCRHHAAAVMDAASGEAPHLRCPYHAWTYSLEGDLKTAPDLGAVCNFDRQSMGLMPVETQTWKQWVLVTLERGGPP